MLNHDLFKSVLTSLFMIIITAFLVFDTVLLIPVDVLKNWRITVAGGTHQTGQEIVVKGTFQKVRNVAAITSQRSIQCGNQSYDINQAKGKSNNIGHGVATIKLVIPDDILAPAQCRIRITAKYPIYGIRIHTETAQTNKFNLEK